MISKDEEKATKTTRFFAWLQENGSSINPSIEIKHSEGSGHYVCAKSDIPSGELLFRIPKSILFHVGTSVLKEKIQLWDLSAWDSLILCILYEYGQSGSFFKPYFSMLPHSLHLPLFWTPAQLEHLRGTSIHETASDLSVRAQYESIVEPILAQHPEYFSDRTLFNYEMYRLVGGIVKAYSFTCPSKGASLNEDIAEDQLLEDSFPDSEGDICMVPLADMLNHKTGLNNARLFFEEDHLEMISIQPIAAGKEVFNTYGPLNNSDLLLNYGFVDLDNPVVSMHFSHVEVLKHARKALKLEESEIVSKKMDFLKENDMIPGYYIFSSEELFADSIKCIFRILESSLKEFDSFCEISPDLLVEHILDTQVREKSLFCEFYFDLVSERESILKKTFSLINQAPTETSPSETPHRISMAKKIVKEELALLTDLKEAIQSNLEMLEMERKKKKRKL
eukprot:Sdes_comp21511_c0_seq1m20129